MKVFFLGVGAAANSSMFKSSYLIDDKLLIDVSPEAPTILNRHEFDLGNITSILVTHLHGDHFFGLPMLLTEYLVRPYTQERLRIFGPLGLSSATESLLHLAFPDVKRDLFLSRSKASFEVLKPFVNLEIDDIRVQVIPVTHGAIQAYGFLIETNDASVFISGDTTLNTNVREAVEKADFSILDATTEIDRLPTHMNLDDVIAVSYGLRKDQYILATHRAFNRKSNIEQIIFPTDFQTFELIRACKPTILM